MTERHDDVLALIDKAQRQYTNGRPPKVRQRWIGDVAVHTRPNEGDNLATALRDSSPKTWNHTVIANGPNWVSLSTEYVAKGANADDAEKLVRRVADKIGVTIDEVAVDTHGVTVLGDA